jgi:hypothetical protein
LDFKHHLPHHLPPILICSAIHYIQVLLCALPDAMSDHYLFPFEELAHSITNSTGPEITPDIRAEIRTAIDSDNAPVSDTAPTYSLAT